MQLLLLRILALLPLVQATSLIFRLPPTAVLPAPLALSPITSATLTKASSPPLSIPISRTATFVFHDLAPGSYLAEIWARDFNFVPMRVDVNEDGRIDVWQTFRGNEWENKGEKLAGSSGQTGKLVVDVGVLSPRPVVETRGGFSPMSLLQSPMVLIAIVGIAFTFGMPKLLENMGPELKAEFEASHSKSALTSGNPLGNFDPAAWLAGSSTPKSIDTESPASETEGRATGSMKSGGGAGSKRRR